MKLIRFGPCGQERPGLWHEQRIVDLRLIFPEIPDIGRRFFKEGWIDRLSQIEDGGKPMDVRLGAPVHRPQKLICLGKNYEAHAKEGGFETPERPLLFCKTPNTINGPFDPVIMPRSSDQIDWEVELAVVIGRTAKRVSRSHALDYVAGFTVMNDVSARRAQFAHSQWFRGKSFDTFAPLGPMLVTPDEIPDIHELRLTTKVNGELMQSGNTRDMIFSIEALIEDVSEDITLEPGDVIATGTPEGVGIFRDPPIVLKPGDVVECAIDHIGVIRNQFVNEEMP